MQQRDCVVKLILRGAIARSGKVNCSELLTSPMLMFIREAERRHQNQQDG